MISFATLNPVTLGRFVLGLRVRRYASVLPFLQAPPEVVSGTLLPLMRQIDRPEQLAALINETPAELVGSAVVPLLGQVRHPGHLVILANQVAPERILPFLRLRRVSKAAAFLNGLEPEEVGGAAVPLLLQVRHPEHLAVLLDQASPRALLPFLRGFGTSRLAAFSDGLDREDLEPDGGMMQVLEYATEHPEIIEETLMPLVERVPGSATWLVRRVAMEQLLPILRTVNVDSLVLLLQHADSALLLELLNGPFGKLEGSTALVINNAPMANICAFLSLPPEKVTRAVAALDMRRFAAVALPFMQLPLSRLNAELFPVMRQVVKPERLAAYVNHAPFASLLKFACSGAPDKVASFINRLEPEDLEHDACMMKLLRDAPPDVVESVLVQLVLRVPGPAMQLIQTVSAERLLPVVCEVKGDSLVRMLQNTSTEVVAKSLNGPFGRLDGLVLAKVVGGVAGLINGPVGAGVVQSSSEMMDAGLSMMDTLRGPRSRSPSPPAPATKTTASSDMDCMGKIRVVPWLHCIE